MTGSGGPPAGEDTTTTTDEAVVTGDQWPDEPRFAPGRHRAHDAEREGPVRLVVLGDSFSFTDESGPQLPDAPALWPNVAAAALRRRLELPVEVQVVARPALTAPAALETVRKDRHVQFEVLARAHAVAVAIGSYDHAPMGVPAPVQALVPFLRPPPLRRTVRTALHRAYPRLVRLTGGRYTRTPPSRFDRAHAQLLAHVRGVAHGAAGVAVGPSSHRTGYYGWIHPRFAERAAAQLAQAARQGFATVDAWERVVGHLDELNPDGIHWPRAVHAAVGESVAAALAPQLLGEAERPPRPGRDE